MSTADREIVITRVFDAPRELVFGMWTDPKHVAKWWGPNGFTTTTHAMDAKPGGVWRFVMHGPDGRDYPNKITYLEVAKPERLVYQHGGEDDYEDIQFHVTVTFEDVGGKTRLTMRSVFPSAAQLERVVRENGAVQGGIQHVGRLGEHLEVQTGRKSNTLTLALPSDREIVLTRVFDAP